MASSTSRNGICTTRTLRYKFLYWYILICVPVYIAQVYFQAQTQLSTYDTRHSHDALIIDALIAGRKFLPRHINHIPSYPHYTLTRAKPQIQLHNGKIKNLHKIKPNAQSQIECSL